VLQRHSQDDGIIDTCTSGRAGRQGRHPMIPPSCFRDPTGTRNMALHKSPSPRTVAEKELTCLTILAVMPGVDTVSPDEGIGTF
jgi:hypothetical protein